LVFASCNQACGRCFTDHYQGCLAYCDSGCETYCTTQLPAENCTGIAGSRLEQWTAEVASIFQALDPKARMCQATGLSGCPSMIRPQQKPTPMPLEPYIAASRPGPASTKSFSEMWPHHPVPESVRMAA
jgi:hypothetical protein